MIVFRFDNTFEGLLTLVFESYRLKQFPDAIVGGTGSQSLLFADTFEVVTDDAKAERVWNKIVEKSSLAGAHRLYRVFLSELPEAPLLIFRYIRLVVGAKVNVETDFSQPVVLEVGQIHRKVVREAQRIQMFTRFQQTAEGSYYASFVPQYNVLPLCIPHFCDRFADQEWIIYDLRRNFGFHYDRKEVVQITFENLRVNPQTGQLHQSLLDPGELQFQRLWKKYYDAVFIPQRKNIKVHRQFLPKRFWSYLPEKRSF